MKLLSIAIPCYNSEKYMRKCVESLLIGGDDVEILIVNDGSTKDKTAEIADEYAAKYPTIVKAIHKENGGHGSAVNAGIANASGLFFKVVDSDDWVKEDYLERLVELQKKYQTSMVICGYEKAHKTICDEDKGAYENQGEDQKIDSSPPQKRIERCPCRLSELQPYLKVKNYINGRNRQ